MGNVTGTLIENAFQPEASNQPPVDIQEEIKRLARDSSKQELYRLLHVEMEHGTKERISIAQSCPITETPEADDVKGVAAEILESTRSSSDNFHAQGSSASWKYRNDLPQTTELSQSRNRGCSAKYENGDILDSSNGKHLDGVTKVVSGQEESCIAPRMAFKKKILNSYRTENEEPAKEDNSTVAKRMRMEEPVESTGKNVTENGPKAVTKVLNFDNCIQVIVMNELQKLEATPNDLPSAKKLELFGKLGSSRESQKNRLSEGDKNKLSKDRGSVESGWPSKTEKTAGQSASFEPKRDKLSPYGCLESAGQNPSDTSVHRARARKVEVGHGVPSARSAPSYRAIGHPEAPEVQRMYPPSLGDGLARNSRQIGSQQSEVADGKVSAHYGPTPFAKYPHPGVWGHGQEHLAVQPSPHLLLADPGYRMTSSNQMAQPMIDHRRRVDKEHESVRLPRPEYISYSGSSSQHPLIPSQPSQRSSYQNSPPVAPDKHHRMDIASYLYPAKAASHERVHSQYETSYPNQPEGLHPPAMSYLKHSPKNSPHLAYDKEPVHPVGELQYNRTELLKTSPGCSLAGSARNYRPATEHSNTGYRGERLGRPDAQLDKRTYGMHNGEDLELEKYFRNPVASNNRDVPVGPDQRSFSTSFLPRGRDSLDRGVAGPTEESPLDLTTKRDVRISHHGSVYLVPSGAKQHQPEWEMAKSIGYRPSYVHEEDPVHANMFRPASQKASDVVVSEQVGRRDVLDGRQTYEKVPHGLTTMQQPDSNYGRVIPTPGQERNMRASIVASHPFDDMALSLGPPSHLSMQQVSEALKSQHSVNNWKPVAYQEVLPQSHAMILEPESSFRGGGQEQTRPRPGNPSGDLLHLTTTSPTIPHLSPIQPLVAPVGGRRVSGPSLLGSHSPSDILHLQCKVCGSTYGSLRSFRMHFAKVHGLEPLPEHCNISTISGTKNAMSKIISVDDNEPPALQREPLPSDIGSSGRSRSFAFDQFSNGSRPVKPDALHSDVLPVTVRTEQVAQVFPMPARVAHGLSPQLKVDPVVRRPSLNDTQTEPTEAKTKMANDAKGGGHVVNCDLGIIRSRNCYSDVGCDVDCPECLDGFKDISDWKMHISTHMMRSCSCKACNLSFTHSGALKRHLQTVHVPTEKVDVEFRCLFCREVFSDEKILFQHTQEHEKKYSRVENTRRGSSSSQSYKQHDGSVDSDGIQMAIPDTTSSDDIRPTSGFRENCSNISPSTDSKGSSFDRRSFADLLASGPSNVEPDNFRRFADVKIEDENSSCRAVVMGEIGKMTRQSKSPGSASMAQSESSDAEKEVKPARASEDSVAFVSKKQAFLKRFKSTEERESVDSDTSQLSSLSAQPGSNGALCTGRPGTVLVLADNADVQQPMHLRDLFSIMSHQVEKSIRGIPDFPPVTSFVPAQRSRCVRDVCDEIIAQSFRKDKSPRDGVSSVSALEGFELSSNDNVKEQFKTLVNVELDSQMPEVVQSLRSSAEVSGGTQNGGWFPSPCSSRDSYHSLEIDESQFDKERSLEGSTEVSRSKCTDVDKRGLNYESSPRPESEQHCTDDSPERRKCDSREDIFRALENEIGGVRPPQRDFNRQGKLEDSESCASHTTSANFKESCSPSSTQKLDVCGENDGSTDPSTGHGQKRKHSTSDMSKTGVADDDIEPTREKIL